MRPERFLRLLRPLRRLLPLLVCAVPMATWTAGSAAPLLPAAMAGADDKPAQPAAEAKVTIFNRDIVTLRSAVLGFGPADRARRAEQRIEQQLDLPGAHASSLQDLPQGTLLAIDGVAMLLVAPGDVDLGESPQQVAERARKALDVAIAETREGRDAQTLLRAAAYAVLETAALALLLWGLHRSRRVLEGWVLRLSHRHAERLRMGGAELVLRERIGIVVHGLLVVLYWVLALLAVYVWLGKFLALFPYTRVWGERLSAFLFGVVAGIVEGIAAAVPNLFVAFIIVLIARFTGQLSDGLFERIRTRQIEVGWLDAELAGTTRRIVKVAIWLFALAMAYPYLPGAQTEAFKGVSVLVGLMISLGASNLIGQLASGLIITYSRILRRGEFVRIADHEGTVTELGMFGTRIRSGMGEEFHLPNSMVLGAVTKNYSRAVKGTGFTIDTTVTIGYDTPWRQVQAMLLEAAQRTRGLLTDPAPRVIQTSLSDFYVEYRLIGQAVPSEPQPRSEVMNALHGNIQDVFNEYGVQIMSPHYMADTPVAKTVPKADWHLPPAKPPA